MPKAISKTKNFGVRLHIGPYMTISDHSPVLVPSEMHAFIRLDATKRQYKDTCVNNPKLKYTPMYNPGLCTWEQVFIASNEHCNCSPLGYYLDNEDLGMKRLCNIEEVRTCVIPIRTGIGQWGPLVKWSCSIFFLFRIKARICRSRKHVSLKNVSGNFLPNVSGLRGKLLLTFLEVNNCWLFWDINCCWLFGR